MGHFFLLLLFGVLSLVVSENVFDKSLYNIEQSCDQQSNIKMTESKQDLDLVKNELHDVARKMKHIIDNLSSLYMSDFATVRLTDEIEKLTKEIDVNTVNAEGKDCRVTVDKLKNIYRGFHCVHSNVFMTMWPFTGDNDTIPVELTCFTRYITLEQKSDTEEIFTSHTNIELQAIADRSQAVRNVLVNSCVFYV